jgi:hypothetical protein
MVQAINQADAERRRVIVLNPTNPKEDLSERWDEHPERYAAFKAGIRELQQRWSALLSKKGNVSTDLENLFGEPVKQAYTKQGQRVQIDRLKGALGITGTGLIVPATSNIPAVPRNTFYGEEK